MVDMLNTCMAGRKQRNLVMHIVNPQKGCLPDTVADFCPEDFCPETFVAHGIRGTHAHVRETLVTRITRREEAHAAVVGPGDQVYRIAAGVLEVDEGPDAALVAFARRSTVNAVAGIFKLTGCGLHDFFIQHFKTRGVVMRVTVEVHQRVVAVIAAKVDLFRRFGVAAPGAFTQAQYLFCVARCSGQVGRTQADVPNIMQMDHVAPWQWRVKISAATLSAHLLPHQP